MRSVYEVQHSSLYSYERQKNFIRALEAMAPGSWFYSSMDGVAGVGDDEICCWITGLSKLGDELKQLEHMSRVLLCLATEGGPEVRKVRVRDRENMERLLRLDL